MACWRHFGNRGKRFDECQHLIDPTRSWTTFAHAPLHSPASRAFGVITGWDRICYPHGIACTNCICKIRKSERRLVSLFGRGTGSTSRPLACRRGVRGAVVGPNPEPNAQAGEIGAVADFGVWRIAFRLGGSAAEMLAWRRNRRSQPLRV
jgi:hypothetical protein